MKTDYNVSQKVIHWLMAILISLDLFVAQKFGNVMEEADRLESRIDHGSLNIIVAVLFLIRMYLRFRHGAPALPTTMPGWQILAARFAHAILSGLATAMNAAYPIALFGVLDITIGQTNEDTFSFIRQFHEFATEALIALIIVHLIAAIYHWLISRDRITQRMFKFWQTEKD